MVKTEMEKAFDIGLPLLVDIGFGQNWLEAHLITIVLTQAKKLTQARVVMNFHS